MVELRLLLLYLIPPATTPCDVFDHLSSVDAALITKLNVLSAIAPMMSKLTIIRGLPLLSANAAIINELRLSPAIAPMFLRLSVVRGPLHHAAIVL